MSNYETKVQNHESGSWVRQTFFRPRLGGADEHVSKLSSPAELNFYDTSPGGNRSINCQHQFTDHCDPRPGTRIAIGDGMGRYYTEAIDQNSQRVSFAFGVPEFNSLTRFFANYYDRDLGKLVNTGETSGLAFKAGYALGTLFTLPIQALFGVNALYTRIKSFATNTPYSKFYYMRPTMPLYWTAVSLMVNQLTNMMGVTQGLTQANISDGGQYKNATLDQANISTLNRTIPSIAVGDGSHGIDVYAMSTRAQRRANAFEENMAAAMESLGPNASYEAIQNRILEVTDSPASYKSRSDTPDLESYMARYSSSAFAKGQSLVNLNPNAPGTPKAETESVVETPRDKGALENFAEEFQAQIRDGSAFVTFEVQHTGPTSESFSSTTKESAISSALNGAASAAKDFKFNFAGGNVDDGVIGSTIGGLASTLMDFMGGALESIGLSGLSAIGGGSRVDIPEMYDNSTAQVGNTDYTIVLSTPYGNKMSILLDIYVPLCMLLAGALPRSTGKNSYGSPFLCRAFHQGTSDIKTGIIESINITRGTDNIGLSRDRLPTTVEVSITMKNLDPIMHMPIKESLSDELLGFSHFDEPNAMSDYMSTLSAMSLSESFYLAPRLKLAWERTKVDWTSAFSSARLAQTASNTLPGQAWRALAKASTLYN